MPDLILQEDEITYVVSYIVSLKDNR